MEIRESANMRASVLKPQAFFAALQESPAPRKNRHGTAMKAKSKGERMSNQNNRVLGRLGARGLTPDEERIVTGGGPRRGTDTVCTLPTLTRPADGDPGECN